MRTSILSVLIAASIWLIGCKTVPQPAADKPSVVKPDVEAILEPTKSIMKIRVVSQRYDFFRPWTKKQPSSARGLAVVIEGNRLIAPANLVQDHNYIELEHITTGERVPAKLILVDYEADLALVEPVDTNVLKDMTPLELAEAVPLKGDASVWQFEENGTPIVTSAVMRRAGSAFGQLFYSFTADLPTYAPTPIGTPVVKDGKLAAIMTGYSKTSRNLSGISVQVLRHFIDDADDGGYLGFPTAGFGFSLLDDPQLREYLQLPEKENGVYVTYVRPGSPAADAQLQKGDVVLAIDKFNIDRKGEYRDELYGKLAFTNLINTYSNTGDLRTFWIWRNGRRQSLEIRLRSMPVSSYPVPPYIHDTPPEFIIVGGVIIQELSGEYLKLYGDRAPMRLEYYRRNQWELVEPESKVVFISYIIPLEGTEDYENFNTKIIDKVNGRKIRDLREVKAALKLPIAKHGRKFHVFGFVTPPHKLVLDLELAEKAETKLKNEYLIPKLSNFNE